MLKFVHFDDMEQRHLDCLAKSLLAAPLDTRLDAADILRGLQNGKLTLFDLADGGCIVVGGQGKTLMLYAFASKGLQTVIKTLTRDVRRLAADWECDIIETTVFDPRIRSVIEKIGGRVESLNMTLPVEPVS